MSGSIKPKKKKMNSKDYQIVDIDYWNKDATFVVGHHRLYFQFDGDEPTLEDVRNDLIKHMPNRGGPEFTLKTYILNMLENDVMDRYEMVFERATVDRFRGLGKNTEIYIECSARRTGKTTRLLNEVERWVERGNFAIVQMESKHLLSINKWRYVALSPRVVAVETETDLNNYIDTKMRGIKFNNLSNAGVRLFCDDVDVVNEPIFDVYGYYTMTHMDGKNQDFIEQLLKQTSGQYTSFRLVEKPQPLNVMEKFRIALEMCKCGDRR
jgi:hypothetical protein